MKVTAILSQEQKTCLESVMSRMLEYFPEVVEFRRGGCAMSKEHRLKPRKSKALADVALNFLLGCSEGALASFELARLDEVANLRKELQATLDRMLDQMAQAALAGWFRSQDRNALRHAIENEETPEEWAHRMILAVPRGSVPLIPPMRLSVGEGKNTGAPRIAMSLLEDKQVLPILQMTRRDYLRLWDRRHPSYNSPELLKTGKVQRIGEGKPGSSFGTLRFKV